MSFILLSISGHDRPGIVRDVSEALLDVKANIEDSSMTALRGRFAMMLIVSLSEDSKISELKAILAGLEQRTGLSVQSQPITDDEAYHTPPEPDYVVTVSGADKPGIVHDVTDCLAALDISVVDLSTRLAGGGDQEPVYMMALEVAVGGQLEAMSQRLDKVSERLQVDVEVHAMESAIL